MKDYLIFVFAFYSGIYGIAFPRNYGIFNIRLCVFPSPFIGVVTG